MVVYSSAEFVAYLDKNRSEIWKSFLRFDREVQDGEQYTNNIIKKLYFLEKMISEHTLLKEVAELSLNSIECWLESDPRPTNKDSLLNSFHQILDRARFVNSCVEFRHFRLGIRFKQDCSFEYLVAQVDHTFGYLLGLKKSSLPVSKKFHTNLLMHRERKEFVQQLLKFLLVSCLYLANHLPDVSPGQIEMILKRANKAQKISKDFKGPAVEST